MKLNNTIVLLQPGMYILRHPKGGLPPLSVSRAPGASGSTGKAELLATPRTHGAVLRDGSDCIVVHIMDAPVEFLVTAFLADETATVPALKIDRIALDEAAPAPSAPTAFAVASKGISLIGHIERTGDALVGADQLLGDPSSGLRLEGFQLVWPDKPEGVDVVYSVSVEGFGELPQVSTGAFCGSRGTASRITGLTLTLVGSNAAQYQLLGEAHFSGGFQLPLRSGVPLSGPSGLEHLTALGVTVQKNVPLEHAPAPLHAALPPDKAKVAAAAGTPAKLPARKQTKKTKPM